MAKTKKIIDSDWVKEVKLMTFPNQTKWRIGSNEISNEISLD